MVPFKALSLGGTVPMTLHVFNEGDESSNDDVIGVVRLQIPAQTGEHNRPSDKKHCDIEPGSRDWIEGRLASSGKLVRREHRGVVCKGSGAGTLGSLYIRWTVVDLTELAAMHSTAQHNEDSSRILAHLKAVKEKADALQPDNSAGEFARHVAGESQVMQLFEDTVAKTPFEELCTLNMPVVRAKILQVIPPPPALSC